MCLIRMPHRFQYSGISYVAGLSVGDENARKVANPDWVNHSWKMRSPLPPDVPRKISTAI
jgi:hypothetical protein